MPYNPYQFNFDPNRDYTQPQGNPFPQQRLKNIFAQPQTQQDNAKRFLSGINPPPKLDASPPTSDTSSDPSDEGGKYFDAMRRMSRQGPAVSAYQAALKDQPTDDNVEVSTARKIMGTIAGAAGGFARGPEAGVNVANEIIDSPYKTAMRDYQVKMKNLGESAKLEQDDQTSQLNAMAKAREYGLKYNEYRSKLDQEKTANEFKGREVASGETNAQAATQRATAAEAAAASQGKNIDSEIATRAGTLTNEQKRTGIQGENAATAAAAQKDLAKYHEGELAARNKSIDVRSKAGKTVTPSQQAYAVDNALRELATDPKFKKYVLPNADKGTYNMEVDDNSLMYQEFRRRVKALAESSIRAGTPFDEDIDSPVSIGAPR